MCNNRACSPWPCTASETSSSKASPRSTGLSIALRPQRINTIGRALNDCLSPLKLGHHVSTFERSERWPGSGIPTRTY
jgi:hypothetical protein